MALTADERSTSTMTGRSTPAQGGVTDDPIRIGTMLYTLVEPHRGHEVAYNRWYERDHFYAGLPDRRLQLRRRPVRGHRPAEGPALPGGRRRPWSPIRRSAATSASTTCSTATTTSGTGGRSTRSTSSTPPAACSSDRDHIHTGLYRFEWEHRRDEDGVPAELTLDHRFPGMVSVFIEPADGSHRPSRSAPGTGTSTCPRCCPGRRWPPCSAFSPLPLLADAPGDVPRARVGGPSGSCCCGSSTRTRPASWDAVFARQAEAPSTASGLGRVLWASPFVGTVPGTDTYTDQLWSDDGLMTDFIDELDRRTAARGWVGAPTLWELIERRAAATPDAVLAHEDTGEELTFAGYRDACLRAAAGLLADYGVDQRAPA